MQGILGGIRRLTSASIWGRNSVAAEDARLAGLLRYGLPSFDLFIILFGVLGFAGGIPALRATFTPGYAEVWALVLANTGLLAGIGIAFPSRLWRLEFTAKAFMVGLIAVYVGAVFIAGAANGDIGRAAVGWAILAMGVLPSWRLTDIAKDRRKHGWR
jgi:hypothetical protein